MVLVSFVNAHCAFHRFPCGDRSDAVDWILKGPYQSCQTHEFRHIDANDLILWKVALADDDNNEEPVQVEQASEKSKLKGASMMSKVFGADVLE
ncbi:hypothetical protein DFQ26_005304, partial [Actinomortierella ambigua]